MQKIVDFILRYKEYIALTALTIMCFSLISMGDVSRIGGFRTVLIGGFGWFRDAFSFIPNTAALQNENKALRELNLMLSKEVTRMRKSLLENENLKGMLNLREKKEYEYLPSNVVGRTTIEMRNYFMLDKGSAVGIQDGMTVRTAAGVVGLVVGVDQNYALVESLKNREIKISAKIIRSSIDGLLVWEGGQDFYLKNVPKSFDVKVGDEVVSSDYSSRFPKDIPIGRVEKISDEQGDLFMRIAVKPFVDFSAVEQVFVIKYLPDPERQNIINHIDEILKARKLSKNRK
jgi:rod shape-determining protein MreC